VVWIGAGSKNRSTGSGAPASDLVPAKLGPEQAGGSIPPAGGVPGGVTDSVPVTGSGGTGTGSIVESLVLAKGETYYGKGEEFFRNGDFASASRYLSAEVGRHPDRFYPTYLLGLSQWKEGSLVDAAATLTTASSLDTKSVKARVNLGRVLNDAGSFDKALAAADEAIALDPESSQAHDVRGRALLNLRRADEAVETFKTSVQKDPNNAWARNNLGYALVGQGRFAEAIPELEEAVRLNPGVGCFQNNLGMAYERTGRKDEAIAAYRKAVQEGGSDRAGDNLARLGGVVDDEKLTAGAEESSN